MNSKQYACIFLALYVLVFALAFSLIKFATREVKEESSSTVYIELVAPEPEPEKKVEENKQISNATPTPTEKPKPKAKDTSSHEKPAPEPKSQEANGPAEKPRTPKERSLFPGMTGGQDKPVPQGNKGEVSPELANSGKKYGLNNTGKDSADEGPESNRKLKGDYLPQTDPSKVKEQGKVVVKVTINNKGRVTHAEICVGTTIKDSGTKNEILAKAKEALFEESAAYVDTAIIEYHCNQGNVSYTIK